MRRRSPSPSQVSLFAKSKIMDLLASRDHSEKELRQKLTQAFRRSFQAKKRFSRDQQNSSEFDFDNRVAEIHVAIEEALDFARTNGWMGSEQQLSENMATALHRRNKGIKYINNYLHEKGLPAVAKNSALELAKALALVKNKVSDTSELSYAEKQKERARIARFLVSRGFEPDIVRKVIYEKL